jgi:pimeloyl-ACP methyl ester carboxylesterase
MSQRFPCRSCQIVVLLLVAICAGLSTEVTTRAAGPCPCEKANALVLVADGAGDFRCASTTLAQVVEEAHAPLCVQPYIWSHGHFRILADQMCHDHMRNQGKHLAELVLALQQHHPETPIYLVAHSAGTGVVLIAAEALPPDSIERIILLSPAVSTRRDLRGALRAARQGVDVFYSKDDWWYLGAVVSLVGTSDRHWESAAGRVGFRPTVSCLDDGPLYEKLCQHPWEESLTWTGHKGGHYGGYQPGYLKACVLPLLGISCEPRLSGNGGN